MEINFNTKRMTEEADHGRGPGRAATPMQRLVPSVEPEAKAGPPEYPCSCPDCFAIRDW